MSGKSSFPYRKFDRRPHPHIVKQVLEDYRRGIKPTREQVQNWHRYQILSFLQGLPPKIPVEDCQSFKDILELEKRNDAALFHYFYITAIASGCQEILPDLEQFMEKIGRMLFILPVVRAMTEAEWTRGVIRPLFERVRNRHHQITAHQVDEMLKKAGL